MTVPDQVPKLDLMTFPLHGLRLIEASAGTGKTYSIEALYVRLVLGHGRGEHGELMPPNILVLTYTRAATRELRDRIRNRLTGAAKAFRTGDSCKDEFVAELLKALPGKEERANCARRLQVAAEWMDEAAIHTIHAWCQTMLRQHAFDSGSLFDQDVEGEDRELLQQVINDYWRRFMYIEHEHAGKLGEIAETPAGLAKKLRDLLKHGLEMRINGEIARGKSPVEALDSLVESLGESKKESERLLETLRAAWFDNRNAVTAELRKAVDQKFFKVPYSKWENCQAWIDALNCWDATENLPGILENMRLDALQKCLSKKAQGTWSPEHPWFRKVEDVLDSLPEEPRWTPHVWPHAVRWIQNRYEAEKRQRNRLDFDDLLVQLDQALAGDNGEQLRQRILDSFPVTLVDEFQDTDPVQYRIFERVYMPERDSRANGLFIIGDPKQAIYAFRGADIHTYLAARGRTEGGEMQGAEEPDRFTLAKNYRSTTAMVNSVTHLFQCGERNPDGAFGFRTEESDPVPFLPVEANDLDEKFVVLDESPPQPALPDPDASHPGSEGVVTPPHIALTLWYQPTPADRENVSKTAYREHMASVTATEITRLLDLAREDPPRASFQRKDGRSAPVRPSDMAVLVSARYEADEVQNRLRERGIDSVYLSERNSIFDQPEAVDLLAVLEAAASPLDDRLLRNALGTASLCRSTKELDELSQNEDLLEVELQLFGRLNHIWREQGVLAMIRRLLSSRQVPGRLMERGRGGERALTNLLHLAELLQAESERQNGERGLIAWLRDEIATTERSDNDEHVLRLESDADLVKVITIFKSKGLQYPLVFVPFPCSYKALSESEEFLEYHERNAEKRDIRVMELDGDAEAVKKAQREKLQEQLRLFYVALTRAEHACWVGLAPVYVKPGGGKARSADKPDLAAFAPGHLLRGLMEEDERKADNERQEKSESGQEPGMEELLERLVQGRTDTRLVVTDEDSISDKQVTPERAGSELEPALTYNGKPRKNWWIASYSALHHGKGEAEEHDEADSALRANLEEMSRDDEPGDDLPEPAGIEPAPDTIHAFPRGAVPGNFLHELLEWAGERGFARVLERPDELQAEIHRRLVRRGWADRAEAVVHWLQAQLAAPIRLGDTQVRLVDLAPGGRQYQPELEFWLEASRVDARRIDKLVSAHTLDASARSPFEPSELNGMLHGFIDLVFEHAGRWYVADYKSNWIGPDADYYTFQRMAEIVRSRRYDMQYVLYTLALHRLLKSRLGAGYDPGEHLGGAAYLFLRGCDNPQTAGVFFEAPHVPMIERLDRLFSGREVDHAA